MILNVRQNSFVFLFPPNFFSEEVKKTYENYYKSLILPYDSIDEFMSSTVQQIDFPAWSMPLQEQIRIKGKRQEYKSSMPIEDHFKREFTVTFKFSDAFLNYFIFLDNALNYLDFSNRKQTLEPMRLMLLNNEGYAVSSIIFDNPILKGQDGIKLSYSSVTPDFNTFTATFQYFKFKLETDFG